MTDAQMQRLEPISSQGGLRVDDKPVLGGIIFINRNGLRWRDAPAECSPPETLYSRWVRRGRARSRGCWANLQQGGRVPGQS